MTAAIGTRMLLREAIDLNPIATLDQATIAPPTSARIQAAVIGLLMLRTEIRSGPTSMRSPRQSRIAAITSASIDRSTLTAVSARRRSREDTGCLSERTIDREIQQSHNS